jgi:hypothetical protein
LTFDGAITIQNNPIATVGSRFSRTFSPAWSVGQIGFREMSKEERADGGFWRANFTLLGQKSFLQDFIATRLVSDVLISDNEAQPVWEGFIYEMVLETDISTFRISASQLYNRVWINYRITGTGTTVPSTPIESLESQAHYGIREYVMGGGELESASVADQPVQLFLDKHKLPKPTPVRIGVSADRRANSVPGVTDRIHLKVKCRGYADTLDWQVYNEESAGATTVSTLIETVLDAKAQYIASYEVSPNPTPVTTKFNTDRRSGGIIRDVARLGDTGPQRYVTGVTFARQFFGRRAAAALRATEL